MSKVVVDQTSFLTRRNMFPPNHYKDAISANMRISVSYSIMLIIQGEAK